MTLQTESTTIALDYLHFGHEAVPPINARLSDRDSEIAEFAKSIESHGLIHPLLVKKIGGVYFVADGNRRLAALQHLAGQKSISKEEPIKCEVDESDSDAAELSLAANVMRKDLHPADMYVAFKDLAQRNLNEVQIANRFGVEPARVTKFLALGNIAPVVLDAWRKDELGTRPVETIRAFTMGQTQEDQIRVFEQLKKSDDLNPWAVGKAFGAGDHATQKAMRICGVEAYQAAGGGIVVDLFGDNHAISDPQLVQRLAQEALVAKQEALLDDGWAWVNFADNMPYSWNYAWERLKAGKKNTFTSEQKTQSGCVITISHNGDVSVSHGVVKPSKGAAGTSGEPAEKKPAAISDSLMYRLSASATEAIRDAIVLEPRIGFIALLAGFMADDYGIKPVKVSHQGMQKNGGERGETSFSAAFERLSGMSDSDLFECAAAVAASALDIRSQSSNSMPFKEHNGTLAAELDAGNTYVALRQRFDAEDYFKSVSKEFLLKAIAEAINDDEARKAASLKKPELVAFALANVPDTGWLPIELRTSHYPGPGAQ